MVMMRRDAPRRPEPSGKPAEHGRVTPEDRGRDDYHDPTAGIGGAPPARSALTLRLILAVFGLVTCAAGAAAFLIVVSVPIMAALLAFLAAVAAADIAVVTRRKLRGEPG
jgi:hypothetical protein